MSAAAIFLVPGKVWKWNERTFSRLLQLHWDLKWYSQPTATVCPQNYSLKAKPGFRNQLNFEPMCIFSLQYTDRKILSIAYPYQYFFALKTQKDMAWEKIMKRQHHGTTWEQFQLYEPLCQQIKCSATLALLLWNFWWHSSLGWPGQKRHFSASRLEV